MSIYDLLVNKSGSKGVDFSKYRGNTLLIVNVASRCGFTPQYENLQRLYEKFSEKGFSVLAFLCNDFLNQEPDSESKILEFCDGMYGVTFDLFGKVEIRGVNAHHLYKHLENQIFSVIRPKGIKAKLFQIFTLFHFWRKERRLPRIGEVMWNFHKFVIGRSGHVIGHFSSDCDPFDSRLIACIEGDLSE